MVILHLRDRGYNAVSGQVLSQPGENSVREPGNRLMAVGLRQLQPYRDERCLSCLGFDRIIPLLPPLPLYGYPALA